ncbi:MAG: S24 family peptidase [Desulfomonilaceae bacterium]
MIIPYHPRECKSLGRIAGGPLIQAVEDRETIPIPADLLRRNNIHVLRVTGGSLIADHVLDGDHLIVERPAKRRTRRGSSCRTEVERRTGFHGIVAPPCGLRQ